MVAFLIKNKFKIDLDAMITSKFGGRYPIQWVALYGYTFVVPFALHEYVFAPHARYSYLIRSGDRNENHQVFYDLKPSKSQLCV